MLVMERVGAPDPPEVDHVYVVIEKGGSTSPDGLLTVVGVGWTRGGVPLLIKVLSLLSVMFALVNTVLVTVPVGVAAPVNAIGSVLVRFKL
jgi:hypothetical protein